MLAHETGEDLGDFGFVGLPPFEHDERHVLVFDGQLVKLAARDQFVRGKAAGRRMGIVIAGDDDARRRDLSHDG